MAVYGPDRQYALPVPVLTAEDEAHYLPTSFKAGPTVNEDVPSPQTYTQRWEKLKHLIDRQSVPSPALPRTSLSSWSSQDGETDPEKWVYILQPEEILEVEAAIRKFSEERRGPEELSSTTFLLPVLGPKIKDLWQEAVNRSGVLIIRGIDARKYNLRQNIILYVGILSHLSARLAAQTITNDLVVHLRDSGVITGEKRYRREQFGASAQPFHTDFAPILAMYAVQPAPQGGRCMWASSLRVYEELAASRPEVIPVLERADWPFQSVDDKGMRIADIDPRPVLYWDGSRPFFFFSRRQLTGTPLQNRPLSIPPLTDIQADALDAVQFAAMKHCVRHIPVQGEIQILDNLAILHSREQFFNQNGVERHLIRLWLDNEQLVHSTLHECLQKVFMDVFRSDRLKASIWELGGYNSWETLVDESGHSNT